MKKYILIPFIMATFFSVDVKAHGLKKQMDDMKKQINIMQKQINDMKKII